MRSGSIGEIVQQHLEVDVRYGAAGRVGGAPALVLERADLLARIQEVADAACAGDGRLVAVTGPPGTGKTTVLACAREELLDRGWTVLPAKGGHLERDFPFGIARQLFEAELLGRSEKAREELLRGAAALGEPAALGRAHKLWLADPVSRSGAFHGLYWLTANLAADRPLALVVDDAHWSDPASQAWLDYLCRRLDGLPVLVVVAYRIGEPGVVSEALETLVTDLRAVELQPEPLTEEAVHELLSARLGPVPAELVSACLEQTAGNPLLLDELLHAIAAESSPTVGDVLAAAPRSISRNVLERVRRISPAAVRVASAVAVLGAGAGVRLAAELAGLDVETAAQAADQMMAAGVLGGVAPLEFRHPIVRAAIYEDLPPASRWLAHRRAAEILMQDGADPAAPAAHLLRAEPQGDETSVATLRAAASSALGRGAPETAVAFLRRALDEPPDGTQRPAVLRELGTAELLVHDPAGGRHLRAAFVAGGEPADVADAARLLANAIMFGAADGDPVAVLDAALAQLPASDPGRRLTLEADRFFFAGLAGLPQDQAVAPARRLEEAAADPALGPMHPAVHAARAQLAGYSAIRGLPAEHTLAHAVVALDDPGFLRMVSTESVVWAVAAASVIYTDELDRALSYLDAGVADAARRGSRMGFAHASCFRAQCLWRMGRLGAAEADVIGALATDGGGVPIVQLLAVAGLTNVLVDTGRITEARAFADQHDELIAAADEMHHVVFAYEARARLALAEGNGEEACRAFRDAGSRHMARGADSPAVLPWRSGAAEALILLGRHDEAADLAREELVRAERVGAPRARSAALRALGLAVGGEEGLVRLEQAWHLLDGSPARLDRARAALEYGSALRRSNQRQSAREPLAEAQEIACACGAGPLADRAATELRAAGARPRRVARSGVAALTASEVRIASMAGTGATNREIAQSLFLTVKTVEMHLSNAYRKLQIGGRAELRAAMGSAEDTEGAPPPASP